MSRWFAVLIFLSGCLSSNPCYDLCDCLQPGRLYPDTVTPYGGVCIPNQGVNLPNFGNPGAPPPGAGSVQPLPPVIPGPVPVGPGTMPFPTNPGGLVPPPPSAIMP